MSITVCGVRRVTYSRFGFHITTIQTSALTDIGKRELNDIILSVVVCDIAITAQKIRTRNLAVVIEDFVAE